MPTKGMNRVIQHLRRVVLLQDGAGLTDGQLLKIYLEHGDESAFAVLVRRHGPMVWGVCRRVLGNHQDAEDAFQATFLVLVRRAACVVPREMVANWLYGVARQTSLKARAMAAKRKTRERQVTVMAEPKIVCQDPWSDLQPILDQELSCLSDKYRVAIVLCDLEGKTRKEAARQLGLPEGTLAARLARGRAMLAKRLSRLGLGVSAGALAVALSQNDASAAVPTSVVSGTLQAASLVATGQASAGLISTKVAALTEGVIKAMLITKLKIATAVLLVIAASGAGGLLYQMQAGARANPQNVSSPSAKTDSSSKENVREAAIKALEEFAASKQEADRELAIKALVEFGKHIPRSAQALPSDSIAGRFKHRVAFKIGFTEFKEGGHIEITEVWGTRPQIEVGGQYLVRGRYVLPPGEHGKLYFYETATGDWGRMGTATLDLQSTAVDKQQGEFTLVHGMAGPGYFHLYLAPAENYSRTFANVYFGTGDNVLREISESRPKRESTSPWVFGFFR
ncbi:MAG TPA: RNA polymerase sigma factor [Gemmataceae bacterium]|nr:RNA polymerase sigma factor [Gemmataceae bacterium]